MIGKIFKMLMPDGNGGQVQVLPETVTDAVIDSERGKTLTEVIDGLEISIKEFAPIIYGVEFLRGSLDPVAVRWIGDEQYKRSHPIFYDFKAAKVKGGEVTDVINQTNWFKKDDGNPSNIVWTEPEHDDGSDIAITNTKGFYYIGGGTNETYERHIVSYTPFSYDGDIAQYIEPFGMSADFAVSKNNMQRCIIDMTTAGSRHAGYGGSDYMTGVNGWPSTSISRFNAELRARNKNEDNTQNVPYANAFQLDLRVWTSLLFILFGTKDLHAQDLCGSGISANDSAPTDENWGEKTGVRFLHEGSYKYYNMNSSVFGSAAGSLWDFSQLLNNYNPALRIMEMQQALSHAAANDIGEDTRFEYEGYSYSYVNIPGANGMADGVMTARVRKFFTTTVTGYSNVHAADVESLELEWCLEQPIINGKIGDWGNIWMWYSGIDMLVDGVSQPNRYCMYQTDDVRKLATDTDSGNKGPGFVFSFQTSYDLVDCIGTTLSYAYMRQLYSNTLLGEISGGGLHTGECARFAPYSSIRNNGYVSRRGVYFRGRAYNTYCSSRSAIVYYAPTVTYAYIGVGFRVTLPKSGA